MGASVELAWAGDVDLNNITEIRREIDGALDTPDVDRIVVDLKAVGFVDSMGLGMLVYAVSSAGERGISMSLRHVPTRTRQLLDVAGLSNLLVIEPD